MTTYRDAAGKALAKVESGSREILYLGVRFEVHPHSHGSWSCPACGRWRFWPFPVPRAVLEAEYTVGHWTTPIDGSRGALRRMCDRCRHVWFVEGLRT